MIMLSWSSLSSVTTQPSGMAPVLPGFDLKVRIDRPVVSPGQPRDQTHDVAEGFRQDPLGSLTAECG